jgi:hypothetical protein
MIVDIRRIPWRTAISGSSKISREAESFETVALGDDCGLYEPRKVFMSLPKVRFSPAPPNVSMKRLGRRWIHGAIAKREAGS